MKQCVNVGDCDGPMFATLFCFIYHDLVGPSGAIPRGQCSIGSRTPRPPFSPHGWLTSFGVGWAATISSGCVHVRDHFDSLLCVFCASCVLCVVQTCLICHNGEV